MRVCHQGSPAHWDNKIVHQGSCNCCSFNGSLVADGESVFMPNGILGKCCDGKISETVSTVSSVTVITSNIATITTTKSTTKTTTNNQQPTTNNQQPTTNSKQQTT